MRILRGVLLLLLPLAGCSYLVTRPDNTLAPTASLGRRIAEYGRPKSVKDEWIKSLVSELNQMDGWSPPCDWYTNDMAILTAAMGPGAKEYGFDLAATGYVNAVSEGLRHTQEYFSFSPQENPDTSFLGIYCPNDFKLAWTNTPTLLPGKVNLIRRTVEMLKRIDVEHETLLVNEDSKQYKKRGPSLQMVSQQYPVGVSIARIYPADSQKPVTGKTTGTEIPSPPQIMVNSAYKGNGSPPQIMIGSGYDSGDVATTKPSRDDSDFNPVQDITLTLSTVLNSADTLDRVEYVSTFIYVYPYQKPSNKDVSLGNEFWKKFFAIQSGRFDISIRDGARIIDRTIAEDSIEMDLRRAFEAMAFRFQNVTTTVVTKDLDLGTVSRGTEDTLTAAIGATIPVGPAAINPSLAASSKDTSSVVMKLLRQLDQRSTYISQNADFLRITQRGMSSANLAGRFNEQLQLYIPPAQETLQVLAPYSEDTQQKAGP